MSSPSPLSFFFFFNDTATTEIYTLSLHDALPISLAVRHFIAGHEEGLVAQVEALLAVVAELHLELRGHRSEEHTSELQSPCNLVCRLLLEKKKKTAERRKAHDTRAWSVRSNCSMH